MADTLQLEIAAARLVLGQATAADLKAAASAAIDVGIVTPDTATLAMVHDDTLAETEPMFRNVLRELRVSIPTLDAAAWLVLKTDIRAIAEGAIDPEEGLRGVMGVVYAADLHNRSRQYLGDSHDIHLLVGAYWEIDDVRAHSTEEGFRAKYGTLLEELRNDVVAAARAWMAEHAA